MSTTPNHLCQLEDPFGTLLHVPLLIGPLRVGHAAHHTPAGSNCLQLTCYSGLQLLRVVARSARYRQKSGVCSFDDMAVRH